MRKRWELRRELGFGLETREEGEGLIQPKLPSLRKLRVLGAKRELQMVRGEELQKKPSKKKEDSRCEASKSERLVVREEKKQARKESMREEIAWVSWEEAAIGLLDEGLLGVVLLQVKQQLTDGQVEECYLPSIVCACRSSSSFVLLVLDDDLLFLCLCLSAVSVLFFVFIGL